MGNIREYKDKIKEKQTKVYDNNKLLIMLTYLVGNKVVLQKQLEEILLHYKIYANEQAIYRAIDRLLDAELIEKKKKFNDMNVIVLRNPAIKWIAKEMNEYENKELFNAQSVGKKISDETLYVSLFRMQYYINHMKSSKSVGDLETDLYNLLKNNSLLYRKDKGYEMLLNFATKNIVDRQKKEFHTHVVELRKQKLIKAESPPDRKGKNKEYIENKRESFQNGTANVSTKKQKKKSDKYNFNSILNTKNLVLELDKYDTYEKDNGFGVVIPEYKLYFNLYVMDINNSINYRTLGDMAKKTYLMLKDMFGKETMFVSKNETCRNCSYNVHNKELFKKLKAEKPHAKACYPGTDNQRVNCNQAFQKLIREIYLNVIYVGWNEEKVEDLKLECNKIGYDENGRRDYPNFKHRVTLDKKVIDGYRFDEYITLDYKNYNIDRFDEHIGSKNLEKYNNAKSQNARAEKELQKNDEIVQFIKALNNKLKDNNMSVEEFINSL